MANAVVGEPFRVFVGHDAREQDAYDVCVESMRRLSSIKLDIQPLSMVGLSALGLYRRKTIRDVDGRLWDEFDGRRTPMSTTFSLARFFVPLLCGYRGFALFVDCDFLFRRNIADLIGLIDHRYAVQVVKHCYYVREGLKMDGQINEPYERKNWSSLVLWNCGRAENLRLDAETLNTCPPSYLHRFQWLRDDLIGQLPIEWNWIDVNPAAVHFTYGVPSMPGHENEPYSDEWRSYWFESDRAARPSAIDESGADDEQSGC